MTTGKRATGPAYPSGIRNGAVSADIAIETTDTPERREIAKRVGDWQALRAAKAEKIAKDMRLRYGARLTVMHKLAEKLAEDLIELEKHVRDGASSIGRDAFKFTLYTHLDNLFDRAAMEQVDREEREAGHEAE